MKESKALQILNEQIAEIEKDLVELRERLDNLDANHPLQWGEVASEITRLSERLFVLKRFKQTLTEGD